MSSDIKTSDIKTAIQVYSFIHAAIAVGTAIAAIEVEYKKQPRSLDWVERLGRALANVAWKDHLLVYPLFPGSPPPDELTG